MIITWRMYEGDRLSRWIGLIAMAWLLPANAWAQVTAHALAVHTNDNRVRIVDAFTGQSPYPTAAPILVGRWPVRAAVTPDGRFAYVTNNLDNTVTVIDVVQGTALGAPLVVGREPFGAELFVANAGSDTVSVIATASDSVVATIPVGPRPGFYGMSMTADGRRAFLANRDDGTVSVIDATTHVEVRRLPIPLGTVVGPAIGRGGPKPDWTDWRATARHRG